MSEISWEAGLDSTDPEQRRLVIAALSQAKGPGTSQLVLKAMGDEDWRVRKEAISAAAELGPSAELLDVLIGAFSTSDNVGLRNAVSEALGGFGRPAILRIAREVSSLDADGRKLAAEALGRTGDPSAVSVLSGLLSDPDTNVRVAAIEALGCVAGRQTDEVEPLLRAALQSHEVLVRLAALETTNMLGIVLDWQEIEPTLGVPVLEPAALAAAARTSAIAAADLLVKALVQKAPFEECWPVQALAEYVSQSPEAMRSARQSLSAIGGDVREFLFRLTEADELEVRTAALIVLSALGDEEASRWVLDIAERDELTGIADQLIGAVAALHHSVLQNRMREASPSQRALILRMVARFPTSLAPDAVLDEVARVIESVDSDSVLSAALEVLASTSNERCFRLLASRFTALPTTSRRTAIVVLGEMTQRHPEVARAIADAGPLHGEGWIPVTVLLAALARCGHPASQADIELLTRCLLADLASVRCAALDALAVIGDAAAADAIAFSLADEELEVRLAAVRALGRLRGEGESTPVIGRLIDLAQRTDDRDLLVVAVQAIGETSDPRVLAVLRPLVTSSEPSVAVAAVEAIGLVSDARRFEALVDGLSHLDVDVVKAAMRTLGRESDDRVEAHLGACLDHDAWGVRRLAADLLGQRGGEMAAGLLRARGTAEREPLVKEAIERALGIVEGPLPTRRSSPARDHGSWRPR
jgi:HEAT repeat protein